MAVRIIRPQLDDMGGAAYSATQSGLTISCRMVLNVEATQHLRGLVLETIAWKEARILETKECIESLLTKDELFCSLNEDAVASFKVCRPYGGISKSFRLPRHCGLHLEALACLSIVPVLPRGS